MRRRTTRLALTGLVAGLALSCVTGSAVQLLLGLAVLFMAVGVALLLALGHCWDSGRHD